MTSSPSVTDPALLPLSAASALIASRKLSSTELVKACLARIEKYDGQVNAFVTLTAERALKDAAEADREIAAGRHRGPMHGIPFGLKDIFDTAGVLTTGHSRILEHNIPSKDATTVSKLCQAGGVLLGKLASHEFAHGGPSFDLPWPPARNPWNDEHIPAGSSSGSAAAIAAGFMPAALGTDTGGSIRSPSSLCGIVGLKPTYGLVSRAGVIPNSYSLDNCGPMAWTVEDCAILLQVIAGHDATDPGSARVAIPDYSAELRSGIKGLRIGVLRHFWEEDNKANEEAVAAMEDALLVLAGLGAKLSTARMRPVQDYYDTKIIIAESELLSVHLHEFMTRPGDFGELFRDHVLSAMFFSSSDYVEAQRERRRMLAEMEALYRDYDALVTIAPGPAARFDALDSMSFWKRPSLCTPFNVTSGPALAQCTGFTSSGLPLAMQVTARPFDEQTVFRVAHAFEQATPWRKGRPALSAGAKARPVTSAPVHEHPSPDETTRQLVSVLAARSGLKLNEAQLAHLCLAAPHALAMAARVRKQRARSEEPASTYQAPGAR